MATKPPYCKDPSEYPMHPSCASAFIIASFESDPKKLEDFANATANLYSETAAAQQKFITALKEIFPDWNEPVSKTKK